MLIERPTPLEKGLSFLGRLTGASKKLKMERVPDAPTLTALFAGEMFEEGNVVYEHIIKRAAPYIQLDETNLKNVRKAIEEGPVIYVTINLGQFEYAILNHIFLEGRLPPSVFNNNVRTRWWRPWKETRKNYLDRIRYLSKYKKMPDPLLTGYLKNILLNHQALFLALEETDPSSIGNRTRSLLNTLLESQKESPRPIFIVPVQLVWDKRPRRAKASLFEALFGENERPGRLRKLILFFRHYKKRAVVKMGEAIPLQTFFRGEEKDLVLALARQTLSSLEVEKRALTGPAIRPRSWFLEQILEDELLSKMIYQIAKEKQKPLTSVKRLAHRYSREIAADIHYSRIEFAFLLLDWFFKNLFDRLHVDTEGLKRVKKVLSQGPTVFVPNHRSHIDYLLLSYLCYQNDIVTPHVAAGINMAFWPMGSFFRKCGAFFLRRTFAGNRLYKQVFQTYLKILVREGYLQEFFIEGGRSRTGKLKSPKFGMLSMYSEVLKEGVVEDVQFIPVSITYDKVPEQKSYAKEMEGRPKLKERALDLLKIRKILKGRYGNIYIRFDEPVSWKATAGEIPEESWEKRKQKIVENLSKKICHAINRQVVVIPQALAAGALLTTPRRALPLDKTKLLFKEFFTYLQWKQIPCSESLSSNPEGAVEKAIGQFEQAGLIKTHQGLDQMFFEIPMEKRLELDFFKNTVIHYLVSLSLWSNLLLTRKKESFGRDELAESYAYFQRLFQYEFRFSTRLPLNQHLDKICCYLKEREMIGYDGENITIMDPQRFLLAEYSRLTRNFIESYLIAWKTYLLKPDLLNEEKSLVKLMLSHGKHLLLLGTIQHPEAISQATFENAISAFKSLGLFSYESSLAKKMEDSLAKLLEVC